LISFALGVLVALLLIRLVPALLRLFAMGHVLEVAQDAIDRGVERIAPTISREEAAEIIGVRVPGLAPPPGGDVRFRRGDRFHGAIPDCTRPQPHDGPCNGWPCPPVRAKMGPSIDTLPTGEYRRCRCGVGLVGKGGKCDRCLLRDAGA
jgi:hypothetical protein